MIPFLRNTLLLCLLAPFILTAQHKIPAAEFAEVAVLAMAPVDNDARLTEELARRRPGRARRFAVPLPTNVRPSTHGNWKDFSNGTSVWRLRIQSPGAKTLNLGFSEFNLPAGSNFYLSTQDDRYGPFTPADNDDHNKFWTPLLEGDELLLELRLPTARKKAVQLYLTSVNHDFEGITQSLVSGSCNIDVVCGAEDGFPEIDNYRDIIRSVGAYTLNGIDQCTGFLVNTTKGDGDPLFMTAEHCNVTPNSGSGVVIYWNFENSTCREPGSTASGGAGNGRRDIINSGVVHLASSANSDFTLTRLDDPLNPNANAFFAGWSAEAPVPNERVIAVHHPGVDEKRISFTSQPVFRTNNGSSTPNPNPEGALLQIPFWDQGTTEGGSSGSPLFDLAKRVRGQLFGGQASCSNLDYDVYGYFHTSWDGEGTPGTRLKDHLDPNGTGALTTDGLDQSAIGTLITADNNSVITCNDGTSQIDLRLGNGFPAGTPVVIISSPDELITSLDRNTATGGETVILTITSNDGQVGGRYEVVVRAGSGTETDDITIFVNLQAGEATVPTLSRPAADATGLSTSVILSWDAIEGATAYDVQLATDASFENVIREGLNVEGTDVSVGNPLDNTTTYYWRVRSISVCGPGEWSDGRVFTTGNLVCAQLDSPNVPVTIGNGGPGSYQTTLNVGSSAAVGDLEVTLAIEHTFIGDLDVTLTSPDGTEVVLYDQNSINSNCGAANLYVVFSANSTRSHRDLVERCEGGSPTDYQSFRPLEDLSSFAGESALGEWTLTVRDNANLDGGRIIGFSLNLCTDQGGTTTDFTARALTQELSVCSDESAEVRLALGASFTEEVGLRVEAGDQLLDNYTFEFNRTSGIMTVDFTAWGLLSTGTTDLSFTLLSETGESAAVTIPLEIKPASEAATSLRPADDFRTTAGFLTFAWSEVSGASNYRIELASDLEFTDVVLVENTTETSVNLVRPGAGGTFFWRVVTTSECGDANGEPRVVRFETTGVQDFDNGSRLEIFPNPTRDHISLRVSNNWSGTLSGQLFDASGRQMANFNEVRPAGTLTWTLGQLPAGVYYLRLANEGSFRTERLVVLP